MPQAGIVTTERTMYAYIITYSFFTTNLLRDRVIANLTFSATVTHLIEKSVKVHTPSSRNRDCQCPFPPENSGQFATITKFAIALTQPPISPAFRELG